QADHVDEAGDDKNRELGEDQERKARERQLGDEYRHGKAYPTHAADHEDAAEIYPTRQRGDAELARDVREQGDTERLAHEEPQGDAEADGSCRGLLEVDAV